jgi:SAM-dependent methyltransferase
MDPTAAGTPVPIPGFFKGTEMPTAGWWEALWPNPAEVLARVGIAPGMRVVDLCCGDGWFTLPIARIARQVVAIDIDAELLKVAQLRLAESGVTNCALVEGNAYDITRLVSPPVDFVFMANAFHGVPERTRLARAVAGALAPGRRFAIVNWHARPREETTILGEPRGPATELRMTPELTIEAVLPAGFALDRVVELPPYHYGAVFKCGDAGGMRR